MIQTINPYSEVYIPEYKQTNYEQQIALNEALLNRKQQKYDQAYNQLQSLKSTALNMTMLYEEGREKLGEYNKEISNIFQGDLGDLSKPENQEKFIGTFKNVLGDTRLRTMHIKSNEILNEYGTRDRAKNSKDPYKAGYAELNNWVFEREVQDHISKENTLSLAEGDIMSAYTPKYTMYSDVNMAIKNYTSQLPENLYRTEEVLRETRTVKGKEVSIPTDLIYHRTWSGVKREQVKYALEALEQSDPRFKDQLEVEAKARYFQAKDRGAVDEVLSKEYTDYVGGRKRYLESKLKENEAELKNLVVGPNSPQDQLQRKVDLQEAVELLKQQITDTNNQPGYETYGEEDKKALNYELYKNSVLTRAAEAWKWEKVSQKLRENKSAYIEIARQKLNLQARQTEADIAYKQARLSLAKLKGIGADVTPFEIQKTDTTANDYNPIFGESLPNSTDAFQEVAKYQQELYGQVKPIDLSGNYLNALHLFARDQPVESSKEFQELNGHILLDATKAFKETMSTYGQPLEADLSNPEQTNKEKLQLKSFLENFQSGNLGALGIANTPEIQDLYDRYKMTKENSEDMWNIMTSNYNDVLRLDGNTQINIPGTYSEEMKTEALKEVGLSQVDFDKMWNQWEGKKVVNVTGNPDNVKYNNVLDKIEQKQKRVLTINDLKTSDGKWKIKNWSTGEDEIYNTFEEMVQKSATANLTGTPLNQLIQAHKRTLTTVNDKVGSRMLNLLGGLKLATPRLASMPDQTAAQKQAKERAYQEIRGMWEEWAVQNGQRFTFPGIEDIQDAGIAPTGEIFVQFKPEVFKQSKTSEGGNSKYPNFVYQSTESNFDENQEPKTGSAMPENTYFIMNKRAKQINDHLTMKQITGKPFIFKGKDGIKYRLTTDTGRTGVFITREDNGALNPQGETRKFLKGALLQDVYRTFK
jgi:Icc-related predicted phosphoesterase